MKRLTLSDYGTHKIPPPAGTKYVDRPSYMDVYQRLAAIEDILCDGEDDYDLDRLAVMCNQRMTMREEVSQRFSLTAKMPLDRLRELVEAEREGRCVVLPVKPETPVWSIAFCELGIDGKEHPTYPWPFNSTMVDGWGTDWFLTQEEAEAALKAREQDG